MMPLIELFRDVVALTCPPNHALSLALERFIGHTLARPHPQISSSKAITYPKLISHNKAKSIDNPHNLDKKNPETPYSVGTR